MKMPMDPIYTFTNCYPLQNPTILPTRMNSRWNPTREQVEALEEMYGQGTTTPSIQQIQQITAKLRRFGNIQGKNVFYWFQNHKARDRQKQRQKEAAQIPYSKRSGSSRRYLETRRPKMLPMMSNYTISSKHKVCNEEKGPGQENANYPIVSLQLPKNNYFRNSESGNRENQTLQLFPVSSNDLVSSNEEEATQASRLVPNNFFEFFPTKN